MHVTHSNDSIRHDIIEHVIKHINTSDDDIVRWRIHEIYMDEVRVIVGGDLNGHIGRSREGIERIHGGWVWETGTMKGKR